METSDIIVTVRNGAVMSVLATNAKQLGTVFVKCIENEDVRIEPCDATEIPASALEHRLFAEVCEDAI